MLFIILIAYFQISIFISIYHRSFKFQRIHHQIFELNWNHQNLFCLYVTFFYKLFYWYFNFWAFDRLPPYNEWLSINKTTWVCAIVKIIPWILTTKPHLIIHGDIGHIWIPNWVTYFLPEKIRFKIELEIAHVVNVVK